MNNRGRIAIGEIFILIIGIVAFSGLVGAADDSLENTPYADEPEQEDNSLKNTPYQEETPGDGSSKDPSGFASILKFFVSDNVKGIGGNFLKAGAWYGGTRLVANIAGLDSNQASAAANAAFVGSFVTNTIKNHFATEGAEHWASTEIFGGKLFGLTGAGAAGWAAAIVIFAVTYKDSKTKTVVFECKTWDAPTGGNKCDECNKQGILTCSEYQCHALGQNCVIKEGACVWDNKRNTEPPVISLNEGALLEGYKFVEKNERGVEIVKSGGKCVSAFTPLVFGIDTNKPAKCKMDLDRTKSFEEMEIELNGRNYNHTQAYVFPSSEALNSENPEIQNDGEYEWYIKCQDRNGIESSPEFVLKFCTDPGADQESPIVVASNLNQTSYIKYGQEEIDFSVYTNKPSQCKWTKQDKPYDDMENSMSCSESVVEMNYQGTYPCSTELTGLTNSENKIYVKCKSYPLKEESERTTNQESKIFTIHGTSQILKIDSVTPTGEEVIRGSTEEIEVELKVNTLAGSNEGFAWCEYGTEDDYESGWMFKTNSYEHSQTLTLDEGSYTYYIRCEDNGGNEATSTTSFDVETDDGEPQVVRVFKVGTDLEITTSENSECVYSTSRDLSCDYLYKDGLVMTSLDGLKHSVAWDTSSNYYIKCKDEYGNEPSSDCSIIVKPSLF